MIFGQQICGVLGVPPSPALFQEAARLALQGKDNRVAYDRSWNAYKPLQDEVTRLQNQYEQAKARRLRFQHPEPLSDPVKQFYDQRRRELKGVTDFKRVADDVAWARQEGGLPSRLRLLGTAFQNASDLWALKGEEFWGASQRFFDKIVSAFERIIGRKGSPIAVAAGREIHYFFSRPSYRVPLPPVHSKEDVARVFPTESAMAKDPRMVEKVRSHEIQHVKQFVEGRSKSYKNIWEMIVHEHDDRPAEREAMAVERQVQKYLFA